MPLGNWVELKDGIPERMHFTSFYKGPRDVTDSVTGRVATRTAAVFDVDTLNGAKVNAQFSVLAEKLYTFLEPYIINDTYRDFDFVVTKNGTGFATRFSVQVIPR